MKGEKITIFAILFCFTLNIFAQEVKIQGSLLDSISKEPIPYSNLLLLNSNDSLIDGSISNEKGKFYLKANIKNGYYLKARSIGYQEKIVKFDKENYSGELKLEILLRQDSTLLKEVDIIAQNQVITKFDRKIYKVDEEKKAAARDIFDILRTLPGVIVDEENNVKYKGTSPEIMVDDMPAKYIYPDIAMIPIANIEKIELIDASMQSGGDGTGGIINIKLKKVNTDGFSGAARIRSGLSEKGDRSSSNGYLNVNFKKKKILLFNNSWFYDSRTIIEKNSMGNKTFNQKVYDFEGESNQDYNWNYMVNYLGMQYQFNDKTKLMLSGGITTNSSSSTSNSTNLMTDNNNDVFQKYIYNSFSDGQTISANTSAYLRHSFDTTLRELTAYISYSFPTIENANESTTEYNRIIENSDSINANDIYKRLSSVKESNLFYSVYYNHPITEKTRWNIRYYGWQSNAINNLNEQYINDVFIPRESRYYTGYQHSESLSFRFGSKFGKWKIDGGIRQQFQKFKYDFDHTNDDLSDTIVNVNKSYYNIEPSLNIYLELDSLQDFKITFSRTVRLPYYSYLDGFINKRSPYSWSSGNPDLKAAKYNNVYFSYTLNKPVWNLSAELFYNQTDNAINYISFPITETIYYSMPENIAFENRIGFDFSTYFSIKKKTSLNFSSSIYHSKIDADGISKQLDGTNYTFDDILKKNFGYNAKISSTYKIAKSTSAMLFVQYQSLETSVEGYENARLNSYLSLTQFLFNRKLQLSFSVNNLLNELIDKKSYTNYYGVEETEITNYSTNYNRIYSLSLRYTFRYGDRNTGNVGQDVKN